MAAEFNKKEFLEQTLLKQKELSKRQREYKKILSTRLKSRKETINELAYENTIEQLRQEKNKLRAQIWVANGVTHRRDNARYLRQIQCHVTCQEGLGEDIRNLKISIKNLEREIGRTDKQIYDLNRKTVPDSMHQAHVAKSRKKLAILENQLEVGLRRECACAAENAELREELLKVLNHRAFFNESYAKLVHKLNSDKKYLCDLIEYAVGTFENCIAIYEKMDNLSRKENKELDQRKLEMQGIMRRLAADAENNEFIMTKGKTRKLADLQPKEYRRREEFRKKHHKRIDLYNTVLDKLLIYTKSHNVEAVIEKFQQQRSLYYSYFNYANELSYNITLLNNSVNRLYANITDLKDENTKTLQGQLEKINTLESKLKERREQNTELQEKRDAQDAQLLALVQGIEWLFDIVKADGSSLQHLLGDHTHVDLFNLRRFLRLLEMRIVDLVAYVYIQERADESRPYDEYAVKQIEKIVETTTDLADIVLTQQCPECAEGEAFNMDDVEGGVHVHTFEEARKRQYEKISQPEMQYRLHSISECRLPRSRLLAAKRNV